MQKHRPSGWAPLHLDYPVPTFTILPSPCLQCFDTVGWAAGSTNQTRNAVRHLESVSGVTNPRSRRPKNRSCVIKPVLQVPLRSMHGKLMYVKQKVVMLRGSSRRQHAVQTRRTKLLSCSQCRSERLLSRKLEREK